MKRSQAEHDWLLVDGYNVIGAWQDMRGLASDDLAYARDELADRLLDYCGYTGQTLVLVFDAHKTPKPARKRAMSAQGEHCVVYTKRGQTADNYIESFVRAHSGESMSVVSSDALVQAMIFCHAARISSRELQIAIDAQRQITEKREQQQFTKKQGLAQALAKKELEALEALRHQDGKRRR